jgi:hypothetical protein
MALGAGGRFGGYRGLREAEGGRLQRYLVGAPDLKGKELGNEPERKAEGLHFRAECVGPSLF